MASFESLSSTQKLRAALHRDVRALCTETCHFLGLEITKPAMEIVAELVYKKLSVYGTDLEAFAKHAKRTTINTEDVKLLVRRCPSLKNHLNTIAPHTTTPKEKRRKTVAGKVTETPASKQKEPEAPTSKNNEPDALTSKQKEPEAPTSKQKEPEAPTLKLKAPEALIAQPKEEIKEDERAEIDSMVIDDMIDLTFD